MRYFLLFLLLGFTLLQGKTYNVSGGGDQLQQAVDKLQDGDSIIVTDNKEYGKTTIKRKSFSQFGVVITSQSYLDNVVNGDRRVAGDMPRIKYRDTDNMRPSNSEQAGSDEKNDEGYFLREEYSTNGALRILESSRITVEGFNIDGDGVYQKYFDISWGIQLFGNNAIAIFNSGKITIRGCKIHHAYRGIHIKDRNLMGIFASPNKDDVDGDQFSPAGNPLAMGNHVIEQNQIYENHWGIMFEILWDAASTVKNNIISYNGIKDKDYVVTKGSGDPRDGVDKINWTVWSGAAIKIHGIEKVPLLFQNNTFYKNMLLFHSDKTWGNDGPNLRITNNLFAIADDSYWDNVFKQNGMDGKDNIYNTLFEMRDLFYSQYIGLEQFNINTIAKQWNGDGDIGYVPYATFDGNKKPNNGDNLETYGIGNKNVSGFDNIYLDKSSSETFENTDNSTSNDYFKPKDISAIKDRGRMSLGQYDVDGSKADIGAIDVNGKWAGTGNPLVMFDRDRYAVVDFYEDNGTPTSSVDILFRLQYKGNKIDKIEYVVQEYYADIKNKDANLPDLHQISFDQSTLNSEDIINNLNSGSLVEVRYKGFSPEFNKGDDFARYKLQVKITDVNGKESYSNIGFFDYQKVPMEFKIKLANYNSDGSKGDSWSYGNEITIYEPFWMNINTVNAEGEAVTGMDKYNGANAIVVSPGDENRYLWDDLWRWNSTDVVGSAKPGVDERWVKLFIDGEGNYLNDGWSDDGFWEGVFIFSKPSQGDVYLRANLKGADAYKGSLSGTSVGFKIVSVPDTIEFVEMAITFDEFGTPSFTPGIGTLEMINFIVRDINGNILSGQEVTLTIDGDIGRFIDSDGKEVSSIIVTTDLEGIARVQFMSSNTKGATGKIVAESFGNKTKIVKQNLLTSLIYVDNSPAKPSPNYGYRTNFEKYINTNVANITRENVGGINDVFATQYADPSTTKLIGLDFKVNAKSFPEGSIFKLKAVVTNLQGNVVNVVIPNSSGTGTVVFKPEDPDATNGKFKLVESDAAVYSGAGTVKSKLGYTDFRVAIAWNHVNEIGRLAESGVFIILFYVEDPDGNVDKVKSYYIVK